jgi:large subunit ribosomal protein L3
MLPVVKGILGRKLGMTQVFLEDGRAVPVTVLEAGPCVVVQKRERELDGYEAVQVGYQEIKARRVNSPRAGHFKKAGVEPKRTLAEFRLVDCDALSVGDELRADLFQSGERVNVTGISKGRGFAGGVKRYGFKGGPASHGSMQHRRPASSGATDAARTFKGTRKPGHMGAVRVTVKGLEVLRVDPERNLILVKGAVPGPPGGPIRITLPVRHERKSGKVKIVT